ncbi:MAG: 5-bromo-4-chloroindolyl phosphate hydrolysis family protein [Thiotrichaceae bacterium]|nr:5-bromo-4-chloroindolyl phosphate hydrolysis family protein [Thiotrichaceae bacterium]
MSNIKRINDSKDIIHEVRYGLKGTLLYVLPVPILIATLFSLISGDVIKTLLLALSSAGFLIAAIITRHGLKLESQFVKNTIAKAPDTPYKTVGAIILSLCTGLSAYFLTQYGLLSSILFASATLLGFIFSYGLDPRKDKNNALNFGVSTEDVIKALEAAEINIKGLRTAQRAIVDINIKEQLDRIISKAEGILTTIEKDPRDLDKARKFLRIYLKGAHEVTEKYVDTNEKKAMTEVLKGDFYKVLDSIEETFEHQQNKLNKNNQFDLDVKIEVLETQLKETLKKY